MTLPIVASSVNTGTWLVIAAVAIGLSIRVAVLVRGGKHIFRHR
jgi:hypothetical protein